MSRAKRLFAIIAFASFALIAVGRLFCASHDGISGLHFSLDARKSKYFLGENILLDYKISYDGPGAVELFKQDGLRTDECYVIVTNQDGERVAASTLPIDFHGSSGNSVSRGDSNSIALTIPLMRYCRIDLSGTYRIRVARDLGLSRIAGNSPSSIPDDDPRWAEATIELTVPDTAQAQEIVDRMCRLTWDVEHYRRLGGVWTIPNDFADFTCLRYPIYLPILEKLAAGKNGDKRALAGIAHIPGPEATEALFRLLQQSDSNSDDLVISALCDRLPTPVDANARSRVNPIAVADADPESVNGSWRGEFDVLARQLARRMLAADRLIHVRSGAFILDAVGTPDDTDALHGAIDRIVTLFEMRGSATDISETSAIRETSVELLSALETLTAGGADPPHEPQTAGEISHFVLAIKRQNDFRPTNWEERYKHWIQQSNPYVRQVVLFNPPRLLPESLRAIYHQGIHQIIAASSDPDAIQQAVNIALDLDVSRDEILGMLAERLDSHEAVVYAAVSCYLQELLESSRCDATCPDCLDVPNRAQIAALQAKWNQFLSEHGKEIRVGKHFRYDNGEFLDVVD